MDTEALIVDLKRLRHRKATEVTRHHHEMCKIRSELEDLQKTCSHEMTEGLCDICGYNEEYDDA